MSGLSFGIIIIMNSLFSKSSKVTPVTKYDDSDSKVQRMKNRYKFIIWAQTLLGLNRISLLTSSKSMIFLCRIHSLVLSALTLYYLYNEESIEGSRIVFGDSMCIEYLLLVFITSVLCKYEDFFKNLQIFDDMLNICDEPFIIRPVSKVIFWVLLSITYTVVEYLILTFYVFGADKQPSPMIFLTLLAHDIELAFYCSLLGCILKRLRIMKAHVRSAFEQRENVSKDGNISKLEALSKKVQLDTTSMHRAYEQLHKCARELNSLMSFSMIVILFVSGISTTFIMKSVFKIAQSTESNRVKGQMWIFCGVIRCCKYTLLLVVPCLISSITTKQVSIIRTVLHDAINTMYLEKIERRKVKAFFLLTHDSGFLYALWGVIELNMSLPLSYLSICTTYLVIIIQFSKFID